MSGPHHGPFTNLSNLQGQLHLIGTHLVLQSLPDSSQLEYEEHDFLSVNLAKLKKKIVVNAREVAMRWASLPKGPGKGLGQVCWALRYLGRREVVFSTSGQASHFAAAAFIGGCWIFCLIKLSSR